jgi:hypothetical protein
MEQIIKEASDRVLLRGWTLVLTPEEVLITIEYVKKLIESRPKSPAVACKVVPIDKRPSCKSGEPSWPSAQVLPQNYSNPAPSYSEQLQEELEPLPNAGLRHAC